MCLQKRWSEVQEAQLVGFILTGLPPALPKARARLHVDSWGTKRISLEVDARMPPAEVAQSYSQLRQEYSQDMLGVNPSKDRPMSDKHLELGVFLAKSEGEGAWEELMAAWNREQPEWAYTDRRNFARDAKSAWERITGQRWASRHKQK